MTFIPSEVIVKSTGSLDAEVKRELEAPDPTSSEAEQAIATAKKDDK